ncbi:ATP synthase subunit e, mitochondrial-like [Anthonomus grandis grandis]|uniref:ATP synthase subunit e, mitochondrial-like n=1 Tax=Anthonomus grandis grandis TaxID=2921223 RepID=UPI0021668B78|nr:ATP synthase subunit e, mitochondrial-like [Anthonomus grandis grandis]
MSAAPVRVSPVIKFFRWSFLGTGVVYGAFHQNRLSKKEAAIREVETKQKAIRDAKLAAEKKIASDKEIKELEEMAK